MVVLVGAVFGMICEALIGALIAGGPGMVLGGAGVGIAWAVWSLNQFG